MLRRNFLKSLAAVPFLGFLNPAPASVEAAVAWPAGIGPPEYEIHPPMIYEFGEMNPELYKVIQMIEENFQTRFLPSIMRERKA